MVDRFLHVRENTLRVGVTGSARKPIESLVDLLEVLREDGVLLQRLALAGRDLF